MIDSSPDLQLDLAGQIGGPKFDPETFLPELISRINLKAESARDEKVDDLKAEEMEGERENLLVSLIQLTGELITVVDKDVYEKIIADTDLISKVFKEFLFASFFKQDDG